MEKAFLILEDGSVYEGKAYGARKEVISEIVFNTSMTGYLEVLTDPSYAGQAVIMTYPLIGNYGICLEDMESERAWPDAFIAREFARMPSNFRCDMGIEEFLLKYDIPGIEGLDTRALTKKLRECGTMNGLITTNENFNLDEILPKLKEYKPTGVVKKVTCKEKYELKGDGYKVALLDFGAKKNIARSLNERGCNVTVYPALTKAEDIIATNPDGIMLSNGPGDPKENIFCIDQLKKLIGQKPVFGICLGHQLAALAMGGDTVKLKYGHRGGNQPVRDLKAGRTYITSQNHGYSVVTDSLKDIGIESFRNANDNSCEGMDYPDLKCHTVQFHPEAASGPRDTAVLFDRFVSHMKEGK